MKRKWYFIISGILLAALILGGVGWFLFQNAPYQPGMVREGDSLAAPLDPPAQDPASDAWVVEEGIQIHHFSSGQGRNVLIIHGGPGYPFTQPLEAFQALEDRFEFHYYDQRGCGESTRPIDRFSSQNYSQNTQTLESTLGISAQLADIERIRRILGDDQVILVGHSFGGFLASLYAAEFPEQVAGLVLIAPADLLVMPQEGTDLFESVADNLPEEMIPEYNEFLEEYWNFRDIFSKSDADLAALQEQFGIYYSQTQPMNSGPAQGKPGGWMVWAMYFSMGRRHDYRSALTEVTAPVLVLHGEDDLQSQDVAQMYVDAFPAAELAVIENAGHALFSDQPDPFLEQVGPFLDKLP